MQLKYQEYFTYSTKRGEYYRIEYGGLFGDEKDIDWNKNQPAMYVELERAGGYYGKWVSDVNDEFGELLIKTVYTKPVSCDIDTKPIK